MRHPNYPSTETLGSTQKALGNKTGKEVEIVRRFKKLSKRLCEHFRDPDQ